jgi:hypothetical protein
VTDLGHAGVDTGGQVLQERSAAPLIIIDPAVVATVGTTFAASEGSLSAVQTLATFIDPSGAESRKNAYIAVVQWGDGSVTATSLGVQVYYSQATVDGKGNITGMVASASQVGGIVLGNDGQTFSVNLAHQYAEERLYVITITILHDATAPQVVTNTAVVADPAVVVTAGAGFSATAGVAPSVHTLATFTDPGGPETTGTPYKGTVAWGDGSSSTATLANGGIVLGSDGQTFSVNLAHRYTDGGQYTITITLDHEGVLSPAVTITANVAVIPPPPGVAGPINAAEYPGVAPRYALWASRGQPLPFTLTDSDPLASDQAAGFTFAISWGDGSTQTVTGLSGLTVNHVFPVAGYFQVQVTATNVAGLTSPASTQTEAISVLALEHDPIDPGQIALFVGGTPGSDTIKISGDAHDLFTVRINGVSYDKYQVTGHVFVYTQGGNDTVTYQTQTSDVPAFLFAGGGNDTLNATGSSANNVLVGGSGQDLLVSGKGHNLLIAGLGGSTLRSSSGQDILIGGTTDYDSNLAALGAIMAEWGRTDEDFLTRMAHLNGTLGGGANGATLLTKATVHASGVSDKLSAGSGLDWLFAALSGPDKDVLGSLRRGDVVTAL